MESGGIVYQSNRTTKTLVAEFVRIAPRFIVNDLGLAISFTQVLALK